MIHRGVVCAAVLAGAVSVGVAEEKMAAARHVVMADADLKWVDGPPSLPRGAKAVAMSGDPTRPGPFTMRVKFPAGYRIAPHWHPTTEHVTVLSGSFSMGMGATFDEKAAKALAPGGFSVMPAEMRHYAFTKDGATIQIHGTGPFAVTYVNPADDPRTTAATAR